MFKNLSLEEKEERFEGLLQYAEKIKHTVLKKVCIRILKDHKEELYVRAAGHDGIEKIPYPRTHQCFDGGLLDHLLNVTKNAYHIALNHTDEVDMDLVLFGAILHDIGKTKIFDTWNEEGEVKSNLNYSYLLVDHVYLGEKLVEEYLDQEEISEKFKFQALHSIAAHMDTLNKHMAEAFIVRTADFIDATIENIVSYKRDAVNPILNSYMYKSVNDQK